MSPRQRDLPIGIFDSGVGGLTVLKAVRERLPHESLVYLGDTARLPYGTKSAAAVSTVMRAISQTSPPMSRPTKSSLSERPLRHSFTLIPSVPNW